MSNDIHLLKTRINDLQVENRRLTDEKVMLAKTVTALQNEVFTLRSQSAKELSDARQTSDYRQDS